MVAWRWRGIARLARRANRQAQHLINSAVIGDQVSRHEFPAGSIQFMRKANVQQFRQTCVGVKADPILIRDGHQHVVKQLFQASEALIESLTQEAMIDPAEGTANGTSAIRSWWLGTRFKHFHWQAQSRGRGVGKAIGSCGTYTRTFR